MIECLRSFITGISPQVLHDSCRLQTSFVWRSTWILYWSYYVYFSHVDACDLIASYSLGCPSHADDMQVYISVPATVSQNQSLRVAEGTTHFDQWMTSNTLMLNSGY